ncbi:TlpA family protein disulfide reductase [Pelagicoccus sp. NFK12]|uniref:TlpA family protein disulfide reductase n=1 Tax=Pelagicoccus enzymogenes TaxID=2773457 RepID=A0A927F9K9_9BACT|nr:TlpA disulfide reductase family protein [Pelagicoccus enzymogenes]MBD5779690.1 TlpA family protein disulfide reductase [Pelagicoccus enzymogenes]MDQ8199320.1 TlpA disulfide reductase family protein [Pelagicoccus enzymogenes]
MDFFKRHCSTIVLITIAAFWIGIRLGTDDCPSCVVSNLTDRAFSEEETAVVAEKEPAEKKVNWSTVDTEGKLFSSNDLDGKVGVLVYWATWCGGCKSEIPDLIALRKEFATSDVEIVGLSVDEAHKDLAAFAESAGINYRIARVTPSIVETFGQAESIPTLMIVDQEGRIHFRHTGVVSKDALSERVRSLLATHHIDRAYGI